MKYRKFQQNKLWRDKGGKDSFGVRYYLANLEKYPEVVDED